MSAAVIVHVNHSWSDWLVPFASGVLATALGFVLTMWWDVRKRNAERFRMDVALLGLMEEEVSTNLALLTLNDQLLEHELKHIDSGATNIDALCELQVAGWDSIRLDLTRWLPEHLEVMALFRSIGLSGSQMNQLLRDRAQFRMQGIQSPNYPMRMREFDESIREKTSRLRTSLETLQEELQTIDHQLERSMRRPWGRRHSTR